MCWFVHLESRLLEQREEELDSKSPSADTGTVDLDEPLETRDVDLTYDSSEVNDDPNAALSCTVHKTNKVIY